MLSSPVSSPVSPSWSLVLGTLCSGSIPLLWHQAGSVPVDTLPLGLAWGCGMLLSWERCSAPGHGAASWVQVLQDTPQHPRESWTP